MSKHLFTAVFTLFFATLFPATFAVAQTDTRQPAQSGATGMAEEKCTPADRRKGREAGHWLYKGYRAYQQGEMATAGRYFRHALKLSKEACDREVQAAALLNLGAVAIKAEKMKEAHGYLRSALEISSEIGHEGIQGPALSNLGVVAKIRGKLAEAEEAYRRALPLAESPADRAGYLGNLANVLLIRGEIDAALSLYKQVLEISEHHMLGRGNAHTGLGEIAQVRGNLAAAEKHFRHALKLFKKIRDEKRQSTVLAHLGRNALLQGDLQEAEARLKESLALAEELGSARPQARALEYSGELARLRGNLAEAEKLCKRAQKLYQRGEDRYGQASVLGNLGAVALDRGEFAQSADLLVRALTIFEEMGAENAEVAQFERWRGQALEGQGQTAGACAAWRRSQNLYRRLGSEGQARNVEELMTKAGCPGE